MNATRSLLALLLTIVIWISNLPMKALAETNTAANSLGFAGGSGTETNPYLVETKEQLNNVRNDLDAHYKMIADIEFLETDFAEDGSFYNGFSGWPSGWIPIGTDDYSFSGVFDGNGHSIKNLYIENVGGTFVGLFGYNEGIIKNLSLVSANVYARGQVGGSTLRTSVYVGAIAGYSSGSILNCCSFGSVYAEAKNVGSLSAPYYKVEIYAGGIVGSIGISGAVENCYNNSSVTTYNPMQPHPCVGGIAGVSGGSISHSYNLGDVSSEIPGGIVGELLMYGTNTNCYYLDNTPKGVGSGTDTTTKCTLEDMAKKSTFVGFDFTSVWGFDSNYGYRWPVLKRGYIPTYTCIHNWDNGTIINQPSCKETGKTKYTCTICDGTKTETIAKLTTHTFGNGICSVCGAKDPHYTPPADTSTDSSKQTETSNNQAGNSTNTFNDSTESNEATTNPVEESTEASPPTNSHAEQTGLPTEPTDDEKDDGGNNTALIVVLSVALGGGVGTATFVLLAKKDLLLRIFKK